MKKTLLFLLGVLVMSGGFLNLGISAAEAVATPKPDLMITSLENQNTVFSDHKATYSVSISSIDPVNPQKSMSPYNQADVTVYFKNANNKLIKSKPVAQRNGIYIGNVTLPDAGQWDVLVLALRHGEKEAADQSNVYTMTTQWVVHQPKGNGMVWAIGSILVVFLGIVLYFLIKRTRKRNGKRMTSQL